MFLTSDQRFQVWRQNSVHDCTVLHCSEPIIITFPLSRYDIYNVDRDVKHQTFIIIWLLGICILHTIVAGYYGSTLVIRESVRLSVRPSVVRPSVHPFFVSGWITWVNISGFSPNLVCALILWRSGLGLLMGKFCQFLMELSARDTPIFSFPDYNLSK